MTAALWWDAFVDDKIWIDALIFGVLAGIHILSWPKIDEKTTPAKLAQDSAAKAARAAAEAALATTAAEAAKGGNAANAGDLGRAAEAAKAAAWDAAAEAAKADWAAAAADKERTAQASAMAKSVGIGITAVGILIPATLIAVTLAKPSLAILSQFFFADVWFVLSLIFGLTMTYSLGVGQPPYRRFIGWQYGPQLLALLIGALRLLTAIAILFVGTGK